jgi:hypothetical protein
VASPLPRSSDRAFFTATRISAADNFTAPRCG